MKSIKKLFYLYFYDDLDNPYICSSKKLVNYIISHNYRSYFYKRKLINNIDYFIVVEVL